MRTSIAFPAAAITLMAGTLLAGAAFAQMAPMTPQPPMTNDGARPGNDIGTGQSLPTSNNASNIRSGDTTTAIAPRLPSPPVGDDASPRRYLASARRALEANRTGMAQEALERAESRALDGSVLATDINQPNTTPLVRQIHEARNALAGGNHALALQLIDSAMNSQPAATMPE